MTRKRKSKKDETIEFLETTLAHNVEAIKESGKKKIFTIHDLKSIRPLTETQRMMFESYFMGNNIVASGSAGTGKSYLSIWLALNTVLSKDSPQNRIIIVRSPTPTISQGFLPGNLLEKQEPYEAVFKDIFDDLLRNKNSYDTAKNLGIVEFVTTSYIRGLSWHDCVVVFDECQSSTLHEINSVVTRLGRNSRIILSGDKAQNDLYANKNQKSGMDDLLKIAKQIPEFDIINFTTDDIVRSKFIKSWLCAKEDLGL